MFLIIGGTAAYFLDMEAELGPLERHELDTPYGSAFPIFLLTDSSPAWSSWPPGTRVAFASRHGVLRLDVSPPFVNARANIWAAHQLGVRAILGWNGVGAINPLLELHDLVVLDGLLDFTRTRPRSFAEEAGAARRRGDARHRALRAPAVPPPNPHLFCPTLRTALYAAARSATDRAFACGVYACSEGPRLETAAEIRAYGQMGADVVGMTLIPEVLLAHELGITYGSLAYVTNYATGVEPAHNAPRHFGVAVAQRCLDVVRAAVGHAASQGHCVPDSSGGSL